MNKKIIAVLVALIAMGFVAVLTVVCGCGEPGGADELSVFGSQDVPQEREVCECRPEPPGVGSDALIAGAERELSETRRLVQDLKARGVIKDDMDVFRELLWKIEQGTMTEEDEKRLRRMTHSAEIQCEIERVRRRMHRPAGHRHHRDW